MSDVSFADLGLAEPLLRALDAAKYTVPTPIQARTIPLLLQGRDVLGIAQTGTGKTAAFALPVLQHLAASKERAQPRSPRALVLAPTRELAVQIGRSFDTYGRGLGLRLGMVIGGLGFGRQIETLKRGVDILVATPGRLLDLMSRAMPSSATSASSCSTKPTACSTWASSRTSAASPLRSSKQRQTLMFSATMPGDIAKLAHEILKNPEKVEIAPQGRTIEKIDQSVYFVNAASKRALLSHLLADAALERVIVFTRTKRGANRVAEALEKTGVVVRGDPRQQVAERAPARARRLQPRPGPRAGGDRPRRARHRRARRDPRHQLRAAGRGRELRPSHRPHRARRRLGHRALVLRRQRARPAQEHRAADQPAPRRAAGPGQRGHAAATGRSAVAPAGARGTERASRRKPRSWRPARRSSFRASRSEHRGTSARKPRARSWPRSVSNIIATKLRARRANASGCRATIATSRRARGSRGASIVLTASVRAVIARRATVPVAIVRMPIVPHADRPHADRPHTDRPQTRSPVRRSPAGTATRPQWRGRRFGGRGRAA